MRAARVVTPAPSLILAAHGSVDPRSTAVAEALAGRIRRLRPGLDVRAAFLEKSAPFVGDVLAEVAATGGSAVAVPMLLASAHHAGVDLPSVIERSGAVVDQAAVLGEDPALISLLGHRLAEAGVSADRSDVGVVVVAVGSSSAAANARTATLGPLLEARTRWAVEVAFATGPHPTVGEAAERLRSRGAHRLVVAPWFLAPGRITDRVAKVAGGLGIPMSAPLGAHNLVAGTLLDRYDEALSARIAA
ncbi:sirohydrochlorin chelatase [Mycolicibacterium madagascariense]|uniref:Sirohydrochlorin chelatase n=1 Tax=Mycolicibacterium madagascariense TaxID=212765 RepID=A0A7I7XJJ1_9MYCO|nr:sirohydrochlorin chelatase [Mycolicibacterium madagascariense]BBZ29358.1 sirohydrochlorin chelatase [Mycolicibacterium madagascariense]